MKKLLLITVLLTLVLFGAGRGIAQDDCDPVSLKTWLTERQTWRNASQDVLDTQGMSIPNARTYLYEHLQAIEDLDRPRCADSTMLWTYYLYHGFQYLLTCAENNDTVCLQEMQARLENYRDRDAQVINELGSKVDFSVDTANDLRPDGWTLNITPTAPPVPTNAPVPPTQAPLSVPTSIPGGFACDCNKTCGAMASCEEAYFQLNQCGCNERDEDNDGVPCESICPGG
jgi:hypothetical protein